MNKIKYIVLALSIVGLSSCGDFMDTTPKGMVIPKTVEDFAGLTRDILATYSADPLTEYSCDNFMMPEEYISSYISNSNGKAYFWQKDFFREDEDDKSWNTLYNNIYRMNVVIDNIMEATDGTQDDKNRIITEAKVNRAYNHWMLVNMYAKAYDANTASSDLGIPLAVEANLEAKYSRATIQEVMNQILLDLEGAENYLPEKGVNNFVPTKASAYAMRARVYFYMCEYDKAAAEAEKALSFNSKMQDMREWSFMFEPIPWVGVNGMPQRGYEAPDVLFYRECNFAGAMQRVMAVNPYFSATFDLNDLRYKFYYTTVQSSGSGNYEDGTARCMQELTYSIRVPEMMLIKAEALARKGEMEALDIVNDLRKYRFLNESKLTASKDDLLKVVLEERRRELHMSGLRWFDMKRLAKEGLYTKTLKRSTSTTEYTLEPNSNLYVFPIPGKVMVYNSNIVPNPR